jgi:uncharacterized protein (TIGR02145 family)
MKKIISTSSALAVIILLYACTKDKTPIPLISTKPVSSITLSSAVCGGVISGTSATVTEKGICWSLNENPTISDSKLAVSPEGVTFSATMSNLSSNTVYYVRAYATNTTGTGYGSQISFTTLTDYSGQTGSVDDIDGNTYPTIGIGSQIWMARNLATTKYQDWTSIQHVTDNSAWLHTTLSYCYYDNDPGNKATYGALYNWHTIDSVTSGKNICPAGWHIPSRNEFLTLIDFLGPDAAIKLNESGNVHWFGGNTSTNESGFTALGGGVRNDSWGDFQFLRDAGYLWTSTKAIGMSDAYAVVMYSNYVSADPVYSKAIGMSVRCLKNSSH